MRKRMMRKNFSRKCIIDKTLALSAKKRFKKEIKEDWSPYIFFLLIVCLLAVANAAAVFHHTGESLTELERDEYGSGGRRMGLELTGSYDGISVKKENTVIQIKERELTPEEKQQRIDNLRERLPRLILGDNLHLREIIYPLNLPVVDEETGVSLQWSSDHPELIDEKGNVSCLAADKNPYAVLTAKMTFMDLQEDWVCNVKVSKTKEKSRVEAAILQAMEKEVEMLSKDGAGGQLKLPEESPYGVQFQWKSTSSFRGGLYLLAALVGCLMIYSNQKQQRIKKQEEIKDQVELQLPDFLNKIVMLLSAGLVLTDALDRIASDYLSYRNEQSRKILYEEFILTLNKVKSSNGSMALGLVQLAERMEVKELTRFAVIVADNLEKGNALAEKLELESNLLWKERKSKIEKLGRLADTKLTFPLMITLMSLVVITVVPAILEM